MDSTISFNTGSNRMSFARFGSELAIPIEEALVMLWLILVIVLAAGAAGRFVNVFVGDSGLHLPVVQNGIFRPGFLGIIFVGMMAALASWASLKAVPLFGTSAPLNATTSDIANGILTGFGGAKWFKSEIDKQILRKTASIAASKVADSTAAGDIATSTPMAALNSAMTMK